jgi:hypothetical protein
MGEQNIVIKPLVKPSAWWEGSNLTLLDGELAWEKTDYSNGGRVYMLRGDGFPVNGNGPYTRLRVSGDNIVVSFNAEIIPVNSALADLSNSIQVSNERALTAEGALAEDAAAESARALAAEGVLAGDIAAESARAEAAEGVLAEDVAAESARAEAAEGVLAEEVAEESARALAAEAEETDRAEAAENNLFEMADDLYRLTMDAGGSMLRVLDAVVEGGESIAGISYERRLDAAGDVPDERRELDNAGCCWDSGYVTQPQFDVLYGLVMDTAGEYLMALDSACPNQRENRVLDRAADLPDIYLEADRLIEQGGDPFTDASWMED